jgi:DNA polymerase III alpha subunit
MCRSYGHDRVAQIITFGTLQARAVVRDVGRVLQLPFGLVDRIAKLVPNNPANPVTLAEAIETSRAFAGNGVARSRRSIACSSRAPSSKACTATPPPTPPAW